MVCETLGKKILESREKAAAETLVGIPSDDRGRVQYAADVRI